MSTIPTPAGVVAVSQDLDAQISILIRAHLPQPWTHEWDQAKRRGGACKYSRKVISLSAPILHRASPEDLTETVLHEIAHALAGPDAGHGPKWKMIARQIGSNARRTHTMDTPAAPWVGTCPNGHTIDRHRRPRGAVSCSQCAPGFNPAYSFTWTRHGQRVDQPSPRTPTSSTTYTPVETPWPVVLHSLTPRVLVGLSGHVVGRAGTKLVVRLDADSTAAAARSRTNLGTAVRGSGMDRYELKVPKGCARSTS